jgi:hypothetical protein
MKAVYLLPCTCGNKVLVDAGQAGAKVVCVCGKQLSVPTFRGLRELEVVADGPASAAAAAEDRPWSATRGFLFSAGLLVSVIAAILISYHLYVYSQMRDGGEVYRQQHMEELRRGVDDLSPVQALAEFDEAAKEGLKVMGTPPWAHISKMRDDSYRWLIGSLIALALGLVSMFGSLLVPRGRPDPNTSR